MAFGAIRAQSGTTSLLGYSGEQYTAATGLLHLRARDLNPALGRFLSVDTVRPNAPGSQGYNPYAYVANNPTTWVDPSGHSTLAGTMGLVRLLPQLSRDAALLSAAMPSAIRVALAIGRNPASWTLSRQQITETLVFGVFSFVLLCGLIPDCMNGMIGFGGLAAQAGSDALDGVLAWSAYQLQEAAETFPVLPFQVRPETDQTTTTTSPANPSPNPSGPPGWFWPVALLSALAATDVVTRLVPTPNRHPGPANDPLATPGPSPTPTEDPTCAPDVNYLKQRSTEIWKEWTQGFFLAEINRTVAVLRVQKSNNTCIDIVGGGAAKDLPYAFQTTVLHANEELARSPGDHAEITALSHAFVKGYDNVAMGVSRPICPECRKKIVGDYRGMLIGSREAVWVNP